MCVYLKPLSFNLGTSPWVRIIQLATSYLHFINIVCKRMWYATWLLATIYFPSQNTIPASTRSGDDRIYPTFLCDLTTFGVMNQPIFRYQEHQWNWATVVAYGFLTSTAEWFSAWTGIGRDAATIGQVRRWESQLTGSLPLTTVGSKQVAWMNTAAGDWQDNGWEWIVPPGN